MTTLPQLTALADPTRRSIFERVRRGPASVGRLAEGLPVSRPAVSQHLKVLAEAGLVQVTAEGTRRVYAVDPAGLDELRAWVEAMWDEALDRFGQAARQEKELMMATEQLAPVVKTRIVPLDPARAFELFTTEIARWWPVATHAISDQVADVRFEGRVGGRVVEVAADGTEYAWADVLAWDPPHRFALSWHPNPNPEAASTIEVRFTAAAGGTEVRLEHRGWEEFGERAAELREQYESGWEVVLRPFVDAAGA